MKNRYLFLLKNFIVLAMCKGSLSSILPAAALCSKLTTEAAWTDELRLHGQILLHGLRLPSHLHIGYYPFVLPSVKEKAKL